MNNIISVILFLLLVINFNAQENKASDGKTQDKISLNPAFNDTRIVNGHSVEVL